MKEIKIENPRDKIMCWFWSSSLVKLMDTATGCMHAPFIQLSEYICVSFYADNILWFDDCLLSHVLFVYTAPHQKYTMPIAEDTSKEDTKWERRLFGLHVDVVG